MSVYVVGESMALGSIDNMEQRMVDPDSGVPINSNRQYLIPDPNDPTGKRKGWQRASTLAAMLGDTHGLEIWKLDTTIVGMGLRPDLRLISTTVDRKNRDMMRMLREQSFDSGGGNVKANEGTGFHGISDIIDSDGTVDLGEDLVQYAGMVQAYRNLLVREDIRMPAPEHRGLTGNPSELVVVHPDIKVAGRFDKIRLVRGRNCIVDVKTGQDPVRYSELEYAMQLAIYAHCPKVWYESIGAFGDMPPVDKEIAYVLHVPSQGDYAELIAVDIAMAWRYVLLALQVRASRKVEGLMMRLGRVSARDVVTGPARQPGPIQPSMAAAQAVNMPLVTPQSVAAGMPTGATNDQVAQLPGGSWPPAPVLVQGGTGGTATVVEAASPPDLAALLAQYSASVNTGIASGTSVGEMLTPTEQPPTVPKSRKCSRCKRPGHQARSCSYVTRDDGSPIVDERSTALIASGNATDRDKISDTGQIMSTVELQRDPGVSALPTSPQQGTPDPHADAPLVVMPTRCTCPPDQAGFTQDPSHLPAVVYVHATCHLPAYAPSMAAQAYTVTQLPGQDPGVVAMATQAVQHFASHPTEQPPEGAQWPPAPTTSGPPGSGPAGPSQAPPATPAGATPTPTPVPFPVAGSSSPLPATAATPGTVPPATQPPTPTVPASPGATPPASSTPAAGSGAHAAASWTDQLTAAVHTDQVTAVVKAAQAAGQFDQALAMAAGKRAWELRPGA